MIYPKHIGIIPDGNRTWAKEKGLPKYVGHLEGFNNAVKLIKYIFLSTPINVVTLRGLSTENLKNREKNELEYLFGLYKNITKDLELFLIENKINFRWVGNKEGLPNDLVDFLISKTDEIKFDSDKFVCLAINYGGRDEIIRGINKLLKSGEKEIDEKNFEKYLDFYSLPELDLIIRTKGDVARRLSGFMLWRAGYSEIYFCNKKFPDFSIDDLNRALNWFNEISSERNFGK